MNNFGERLHSARKLAGLSMSELVNRAGNIVTKQAISKYEKGTINPSSGVLIALARALNVKVDYFFRDSKVSINNLEFRKHSRLTKKAEEQIKYQTMNFIEKFLEIEGILNISASFVNPLSRRVVTSNDDVEQAVSELRKEWKLGNGPVFHLLELLEEKGIKVLEITNSKHFDGLSCFISDANVPVIAVASDVDIVRKRFTVAHELAHLLLDLSKVPEESIEKLCHTFAGALLLPANVIKDELGQHRNKITLFELRKLKNLFGISIQAIMARAKMLQIISDHYYRQFCIYANKQGWRKNEPGTYDGKEIASRFKQLVYHGVAEQVISLSKAAEFLNIPIEDLSQELQFVS